MPSLTLPCITVDKLLMNDIKVVVYTGQLDLVVDTMGKSLFVIVFCVLLVKHTHFVFLTVQYLTCQLLCVVCCSCILCGSLHVCMVYCTCYIFAMLFVLLSLPPSSYVFLSLLSLSLSPRYSGMDRASTVARTSRFHEGPALSTLPTLWCQY